MRRILPLFAALAACQVPYGTPRQALVDDRVATLVLHPEQDGWRVAAWTMVAGRTWSDAPPELAWSWVDEPEALDGATPFATGPWPLVRPPAGPTAPWLGLVTTFPSGFVERTVTRVPHAPLAPPAGITLGVLPDRPLDDATEDVLLVDARLAETAEPASFVPEGTWARLEALPGQGPAPSRLRWMGTAGTFLELDTTRTDWAPSALLLDDLDVEGSEPLTPGAVTFLALALDEAGGNAVASRDVWVGPPPTGVTLAGRFVPTDAAVGPGTVRGTLVADDASPTGIALVGAEDVVLDEEVDGDAWGTASLGCAGPTSGPFDPSWLFDGRCVRGDLVGATVVGVAE